MFKYQVWCISFCSELLTGGVSVNCPLFAQIVVQCMNEHPWITAVTPWEKKPECSNCWPTPTWGVQGEADLKEHNNSNSWWYTCQTSINTCIFLAKWEDWRACKVLVLIGWDIWIGCCWWWWGTGSRWKEQGGQRSSKDC